jgi:hydrogenase large subunit
VQVGPNARLLVAYAQGHAETVRVVDAALGQLGAGRESLNSTLGRTLCRAAESVLLARRLEEWFGELQERIKSGDTATFNPDLWDQKAWPKAPEVSFAKQPRTLSLVKSTTASCPLPVRRAEHLEQFRRDAEGQPGPSSMPSPPAATTRSKTRSGRWRCYAPFIHSILPVVRRPLLDLAGGTAVG